MSISQELPELNVIVEQLLLREPKYRDNDRLLCAKIWSLQYGGIDNLKTTTAYDFLVAYSKPVTDLFSQESIGRVRRKIQEEKPELRGVKYKERQAEQANVKRQLGFNFDEEGKN